MENDLAGGFSAKELAKAMRALFNDGEIIANQPLWRGPYRHQVMGIARKSIDDPALNTRASVTDRSAATEAHPSAACARQCPPL